MPETVADNAAYALHRPLPLLNLRPALESGKKLLCVLVTICVVICLHFFGLLLQL